MRMLSRLLSAAVLIAAVGCEEPGAMWHFEDLPRRSLVRAFVKGPGGCRRPILLTADAAPSFGGPLCCRAWDLMASREATAQLAGRTLAIDPGMPLKEGEEKRYLVYFGPGEETAAKPLVTVDAACRVETSTYSAQLGTEEGGILKSLRLKTDGKEIETLGKDGIYWWFNRNPQIHQARLGAVKAQIAAQGPVFTTVRFEYPGILAPRNTMATEYCFFKDCIDVDHHYSCREPAKLDWLKFPITVRACGPTPALHSCGAFRDRECITQGDQNKWLPDPLWHDVSYFGPEPFGIAMIARSRSGALFYMDSVKPDEQEWIYAEPYGWNKTVEITEDLDCQFTYVPHKAGRGMADYVAQFLPDRITAEMSALQQKSGPPLDSDEDGLSDLQELARGTNLQSADTDYDGIPDGRDPQPLQASSIRENRPMPRFTPAPTEQRQSVAKVSPVGGVPTFLVNDRPFGPMTFNRCAMNNRQMVLVGDRGFQLHFLMVGDVGWPDRQEKTFQRLDQSIEAFLDAVPNAYLILRCYLCKPEGFAKERPEECLTFNDGSIRHFTKWYAMKNLPEAERGYPSFASEVWREGTAQALYNYVTHVRQARYADRVVGYFICGGGTEEWYYWGDYDHGKYCVDFSKPMLHAFRVLLQRKYGGDVEKLRAAWGDRHADFATARPPEMEERRRTDFGYFWDPSQSRRVMDYYECHNRVMEESLLIFTKAVKEASAGQALVGMFHGYLKNHWLLEGGQATLKDVLGSPDNDFWGGPPQYDRRGQGEHGCIRFMNASLKDHGKLWVSESDIRTSLVTPAPENPALYGRPPDMDESLACLQREYGHVLCEGANGWWFPMGAEWYDHPRILDLFERMQLVGRSALAFDRSSDTDIAAVVDLDSLFVSPPWPVTNSLIDAFAVQELCRIGAPCDYYEMDDILKPNAKRYKMYIFLNAFSLTPEERRAIQERLARDGATLVWMWAPGLFNPASSPEMALDHCGDLTGIPLDCETGAEMSLQMRLTPEGARWAAGFSPDRAFGDFERPAWVQGKEAGTFVQESPKPRKWQQRFFAKENGVEVLARFVEGSRIASAMRRDARCTTIWIGSVMAPADLLRALARQAGCRLYCDADEIVYASKSFLCIHTRTAGKRTLVLSRRGDVTEVFTGQVIARNATRFEDDIPAYRTRLYFTGSAEAWQAEMKKSTDWLNAFREELRRLRATRPER